MPAQVPQPSRHRHRCRHRSSPWQPAELQPLQGPARRPLVHLGPILTLALARPQTVLPVLPVPQVLPPPEQ